MISTNQQNYQKLNRHHKGHSNEHHHFAVVSEIKDQFHQFDCWRTRSADFTAWKSGQPKADATSRGNQDCVRFQLLASFPHLLKRKDNETSQEWTQVVYGTRCIVQTTPRTSPAKSPLEMKVLKMFFKRSLWTL